MLEAALVFLAAAALGIVQSAPSVTTGDAGEFAAAAAVWGVPHAPGYATWTPLAKAFGTALPFGDWAHRANLLSAVCAAAALALLCDALRRWGASRAARLGAVALLGLAPLWREQSAVAEAFAPLVLSGAGLLWLLAAAGERLLEPGPSATLGLVFGLGLGAHQTLVLVLPALLLAARGRAGALPRALAWAAAGTLAGFTIHLTIPLRAAAGPPLNLGAAATWGPFLRVLLRSDYGTLALTVDGARAFGLGETWAQLARFTRGVVDSFGPAGVALAAIGALGWSRGGLKLRAAVPAAWLLCAGPLFLLLGRPGFDPQTSGALERFQLLAFLGLAPFFTAGLGLVGARSAAFGALAAGLAAFSLLPGALAQSRREDFLAHDYGRAILKTLPRDAILVMDGGDDTFYSLAFLTYAQGLRRDVELRDRGGVVFPGGYGADFRALTKEEKDARRHEYDARRFTTGRLWYSTLNDKIMPEAKLAPAGLLRRPLKAGEAFAGVPWPALRVPPVLPRYRDRALAAFFPYQHGLDALARGRGDEGVSWLSVAAETAPDALWVAPAVSYALGVHGYESMARKAWADAATAYAAGAALEPRKAEPQTNLGVALERAGRLAEAEAAFREAIRREPGYARGWAALGARLWAGARWADAADAFASAAAADPRDAASAGFAEQARRRAGAR